jgi:cytochrome c-type biogenesis protein CcmH
LSLFYAGCAALLILSGVFYLIPRRSLDSVEDDATRSNLEWYRLRKAELERDGDESLEEDARVRLFEDQQQPVASTGSVQSQSFPLWPLPVFVVAATLLLYHRLGAAPDVLISRQLQSVEEAATGQELAGLVTAIEERAAQRPGNLHYVALLGRFYMGQQDYARAASAYRELAREAPQDAQALAYAAQAQYLASGRTLTDEARMLGEQALAVDPHQRTALGLLGMASFEQAKYRAAIEYWERLVALEPPGSETAQMIGGVIDTARQRLGESVAAAEAGVVAVGDEAGAMPGVTVRVAFPDGATVAAADTVFILARNAESESRMPVAVQRLQAGQLPVTLRLDDNNSMAGQKLSELASVMVFVQVSPDGRPGEAAATWLGSAGPLAPSLAVEPLEITLAPRG